MSILLVIIPKKYSFIILISKIRKTIHIQE
jgi:hypothetical protein